MLKQIDNKKTLLNLAGVCDIYSQFSKMVCALQEVNVLPYEKHSNYQKTFNNMRIMSENIDDHSKCDEKNCSWPKYHEHKENILKGKLNDITVVSDEGEPANRIL